MSLSVSAASLAPSMITSWIIALLLRSAPVLTKPADVSRLGQTAQDLFTREAGWTDLYTLAYPDLSQSACGADWRATPWIM